MFNYHELKQQREQQELSQRELAGILGTTQNQVYLWETGKAQPSLKHFINLCQQLGCTYETLIT